MSFKFLSFTTFDMLLEFMFLVLSKVKVGFFLSNLLFLFYFLAVCWNYIFFCFSTVLFSCKFLFSIIGQSLNVCIKRSGLEDTLRDPGIRCVFHNLILLWLFAISTNFNNIWMGVCSSHFQLFLVDFYVITIR